MISRHANKKICINITTYRKEICKEKPKMEDKSQTRKPCKSNKFVCSICLNSRPEQNINKPCRICQKSCEYCQNLYKTDKERNISEPAIHSEAKNIQTSDTNVNQGLNLLNQVLTVFQNKKVDINKEKDKLSLVKDVGVSTDEKLKADLTKLTIKAFQYSIDENKRSENGKFTVVNSFQPDIMKKSLYSISLTKHKSSSIPQMKLEELRHLVKEKSRSKDTIEEVNRMFATVRKSSKDFEDSNRPMVRNGPRVLPLVKNKELKATIPDSVHKSPCRCRRTCMSSGDSCMKSECCRDSEQEGCDDKCIYMLCCHHQNKRNVQTGVLICENCKNLKDDYHYHE